MNLMSVFRYSVHSACANRELFTRHYIYALKRSASAREATMNERRFHLRAHDAIENRTDSKISIIASGYYIRTYVHRAPLFPPHVSCALRRTGVFTIFTQFHADDTRKPEKRFINYRERVADRQVASRQSTFLHTTCAPL